MNALISLPVLIKYISFISQHSENIYWLSTPDFKQCRYLNPAYENIFGYSRIDIYKDLKRFDSYLCPGQLDHYHPFIEMMRRVKLEGQQAKYHEIYRIKRSDGTLCVVEDRGQTIFNAEGQCVGITGVAVDITDQKIITEIQPHFFRCFPIQKRERYYLAGKYRKIYLTCREAECAFYLLKGKTAKQTAIILSLSPRTVECILEKIKMKLNIRYKSDLIDALLTGQLIYSLFT